jgi:hypothetical protein
MNLGLRRERKSTELCNLCRLGVEPVAYICCIQTKLTMRCLSFSIDKISNLENCVLMFPCTGVAGVCALQINYRLTAGGKAARRQKPRVYYFGPSRNTQISHLPGKISPSPKLNWYRRQRSEKQKERTTTRILLSSCTQMLFQDTFLPLCVRAGGKVHGRLFQLSGVPVAGLHF